MEPKPPSTGEMLHQIDILQKLDGPAPISGIVLLAAYYLMIITLAIMFFRRRHHQPCKSRRLSQMVVLAIGSLMMATICGVRLIRANQRCFPMMWLSHVGAVVTVVAFDMRCYALYFQHRMVEEQRLLGDKSLHNPIITVFGGDYSVESYAEQLKAHESTSWFIRHRHLIQGKFWHLTVLINLLVSIFPTFMASIFFSDWGNIPASECLQTASPFSIIIMSVMFVHGCFCCVMAVLLQRFGPDNLGIRLELKVVAILESGYILFVLVIEKLFAAIDRYTYPIALVVAMAACIAVHVMTLALPVCLSYKYKAAKGGREGPTLETLLRSPEGMGAFRRFCEKEFSVENVLFWEDVRLYQEKALALLGEAGETATDRVAVYQAALKIYLKYIAPNAMLQLNAPQSCMAPVRQKFADARKLQQPLADPKIFDEICSHIYRLMHLDS